MNLRTDIQRSTNMGGFQNASNLAFPSIRIGQPHRLAYFPSSPKETKRGKKRTIHPRGEEDRPKRLRWVTRWSWLFPSNFWASQNWFYILPSSAFIPPKAKRQGRLRAHSKTNSVTDSGREFYNRVSGFSLASCLKLQERRSGKMKQFQIGVGICSGKCKDENLTKRLCPKPSAPNAAEGCYHRLYWDI